jgi:hypothetical protein
MMIPAPEPPFVDLGQVRLVWRWHFHIFAILEHLEDEIFPIAILLLHVEAAARNLLPGDEIVRPRTFPDPDKIGLQIGPKEDFIRPQNVTLTRNNVPFRNIVWWIN